MVGNEGAGPNVSVAGATCDRQREQTPPRSSASSAVKQPPNLTAEDAEDAKQGRRLPNTTRKDGGAKELRDALQHHDDHSPITVTWPIDNGNQTVTRTFYPLFRHVDRIEDYRTAYRVMKDRT
jgi:hypothetical protein